MIFTQPLIRKAMQFPPGRFLPQCWPYFELYCEQYEINTTLREAAFFATLIVESDHFKTTVEYASGTAYTTRADLGNTSKPAIDAADRAGAIVGPFYKGHGLIQVTGFLNHKWMSEEMGEDFINYPTKLCLPDQAVRSACIFWRGGVVKKAGHDLNIHADAGDFLASQRAVNRGNPLSRYDPIGWADREGYYNKLLEAAQ